MERWSYLLLGAIAMAFLVCGVFFLRFWRQGRDRFFLLFALSFLVEGANRFALGLSDRPSEGAAGIYLVRLLAFLLILAAVIDKNRGKQALARGGTVGSAAVTRDRDKG
jgi:uncharacterized membrane protein HdeD (DUF308 family)